MISEVTVTMTITRGIPDLVAPSVELELTPCKPPLHIENLRKIYAFISALPDERVNMEYWRCRKVDGHFVGTRVDHLDLNECGTAACVIGWLPVIFDEPIPHGGFGYRDFNLKVGGSLDDTFKVCEPNHPYGSQYGDRPRTKEDALQSMRELAEAYGYTI